jgi:hypothetical protein
MVAILLSFLVVENVFYDSPSLIFIGDGNEKQKTMANFRK